MAKDDEHVTFDGNVVHKTEAAILFHIDDLDEDVWFPISQCELDDSETSILVPRWLVDKKGL
jgi:hypothetical protein